MVTPHNVNPVQWQQNVGYARQACARIFRDGGKPADALRAFGLVSADTDIDWSAAVDRVAAMLSQSSAPIRKAA